MTRHDRAADTACARDRSRARSSSAANVTMIPTSLILVEGNRLLREGLAAMVHHQEDLQIVAALGDRDNVLQKVQQLKPRVVLLDLGLRSHDNLPREKVPGILAATDIALVTLQDERRVQVGTPIKNVRGDGGAMRDRWRGEPWDGSRTIRAACSCRTATTFTTAC
jgi:hypothetical protein